MNIAKMHVQLQQFKKCKNIANIIIEKTAEKLNNKCQELGIDEFKCNEFTQIGNEYYKLYINLRKKLIPYDEFF